MRTPSPNKFIAGLCLVILSLCYPFGLFSQPMWGEEGIVPVWFGVASPWAEPIVDYQDGTYGVILRVDETVPGPMFSRYVELIFNEEGERIDSVRYPIAAYSWLDSIIPISGGGRLIATYSSLSGSAGIVYLGADGEVIWNWEADYDGTSYYTEGRRVFKIIDDMILFVSASYLDRFVYANWLDLETGELIGSVQVTTTPSGAMDYEVHGDSVYIAIDGYGVFDAPFQEIRMAIGDTNFTANILAEEGHEDSRLNYYDGSLIRVSPTGDYIDYTVHVDFFDAERELVYRDTLESIYVVRVNGLKNNRLFSLSREAVRCFDITADGVEENWHSGVASSSGYVEPDDNGGAYAYNDDNSTLYHLSSHGSSLWHVANGAGERVALGYAYIGNSEVHAYSGDTQYRFSNQTGHLLGSQSNLLNSDKGRIENRYLIPSTEEHVWLVYEENDYNYPANEDKLHVKRMPAPTVFPPIDDYSSSTFLTNKAYLTPTSDGGLWIIDQPGQRRLNQNGQPVFEGRTTPFSYDDIAYFAPETDSSPYPVLYQFDSGYESRGIKLAYLDEEGQQVGNELPLFTFGVSYYYHTYYHASVRYCDGVLLFGFLGGQPTCDSYLGYVVPETGDLTTIDSLYPGKTLDVYRDESSFYAILFQVADYNENAAIYGSLALVRSPLVDPEVEEIPLLDSIPANFYGWNDNGYLRSHKARAFFSDKNLLYTLSLDSGLTWNVRQFALDGFLMNGPVPLSATPEDSAVAFMAADSEGCWVVLGQKTFLMDGNLDFQEGYEEGIPFTTWGNVSYDNPAAVQNSEGDLIVVGNEWIYLILAQKFQGFEPEVGVHSKNQNVIPEEFTLATPWPNPFNSTTRLRYSLPHTGEVRLAVYDILGRQVRVLANATQQAGQYEVYWDGCSDAGIGVASGVYFVRAELGEQQLVRKVMLVK